jgi:hypothetical protein
MFLPKKYFYPLALVIVGMLLVHNGSVFAATQSPILQEESIASSSGEKETTALIHASTLLVERLSVSVERVASISAKLKNRTRILSVQSTKNSKYSVVLTQLSTLSKVVEKVAADFALLKKNLTYQSLRTLGPTQYPVLHRQVVELRGRLEEVVAMESSIVLKLKQLTVSNQGSFGDVPATDSAMNR